MKRLSSDTVFAVADFPLACLHHKRHADTDLHCHDFHELVVILGGRGVHLMDGNDYPIEAGDVFLIRGDMHHGYADTDGMSLVNILFEPRRLRLPLYGLSEVPGYHALFRVEPKLRQSDQFQRRLRLALNDLDEIAAMITTLEGELNERRPGYRFAAITTLMRLLGFLSRRYFAEPRVEQQPIQKMSEVLSFIEEHYDKHITIAQLTRIAGVSESTLARAFHKIMGRTPNEHVVRVRVGRAADLLRRSDMRITEIAYACGFSDSNYFARQFRSVLGISPRDYRRQNETPVPGKRARPPRRSQ